MQIEYVAELARLDLSDAEKEKFSQQLKDILKYIEKLNEVDVSQIDPTFRVTQEAPHLRNDEVIPYPFISDALNIAPQIKDGLYLVPPVIE